MLRDWALAEATNPNRWNGLGSRIPPEVLKRARGANQPSLSDDDWDVLEKAIRQFREPLLDTLLPLHLEWYTGNLPFAEIGELRIIKYPPLIQVAPSGRIAEVAEALEAGDSIGDDNFRANVHRLASDFRFREMVGHPIIVGLSSRGPYSVVEGYSRFCAMMLAHRAKSLKPKPVSVILGTSSRVSEWNWWWH